MKKILLCAVIVCACGNINAQKNNDNIWNLERCIAHAITQNLTLQQTNLALQQSNIALQQAKTQRLPTLNAQLGQGFDFGFGVNPATNTITANQTSSATSVGLGTSVVLFNGLQNYYTVHQQQQNLTAQEADVMVAKNNLVLNIANVYLSILFAKEQLQITQAQTQTTQAQTDRMQKLVDAGALSKDNLLNLQAQLANQQFNVITANNQLKNNLLTLQQLLQLTQNNDFDIAPQPTDATPITNESLQTIYENALNTQPELKSTAARLDAAATNVRIAHAALYPRLSLNANVNTFRSNQIKDYANATIRPDGTTQPIGYLPSTNELVLQPNFVVTNLNTLKFGNQLRNNLGESVNLSLSVPIFNGFTTRNNINRAKIGVAQAKISQEQAKQQLYQTIAQAYQNYTAAAAQLAAADQNLAAQKANNDFAKIRFEQGITNTIDYLNIQNAYNNALSTVLQAKYNLLFRTKILDFYAGKQLF